MKPSDYKSLEQVRQLTGIRFGLKTWADAGESVVKVLVSDDLVMLHIETYEVKSLVREDRFNRRGTRMVAIVRSPGSQRWYIDADMISWDDTFVPYTFEKIGRRKTADELIEQREFEKMCHRPGNARNPLDSYERVLDPYFSSPDKMQRHF